MKSLIYGAGAMGTLYGGALHYAGHDVTLLARGHRLRDLLSGGIVLHDAESDGWMYFHVPTIDRLDTNDVFDLIFVFVQRQQLAEVLATLRAYQHAATIVIMSATATGFDPWMAQVGRERLLVGYPGAGSYVERNVVQYRIASPHLQQTMIGEVDGSKSPRLQQVASILKRAGFPVSISHDMLSWHRCHLAWICPLTQALYLSRTGKALAEDPALLGLLVRAMIEAVGCLRSLRVRITPFELRLLEWLPESLLVRNIRRFAQSASFRELVEAHALQAPEEMLLLADEFRQFLLRSSVETPAMDELFQQVSAVRRTIGEGASSGRYVA